MNSETLVINAFNAILIVLMGRVKRNSTAHTFFSIDESDVSIAVVDRWS